MKIKKAFTMAEMTIVLIIIGTIAALTLTSLNSTVDREKAMFKKAYSVAERAVSELINDDSLYTFTGTDTGFKDKSSVDLDGYKDAQGNTITASGGTKFCTLYKYKINSFDRPMGNENDCNFSASDNIDWEIPNNSFTDGSADPDKIKIIADTNGDKEPNCTYNETTCPQPDKFEIYVMWDGKMMVEGNKEQEYLKSTNLNRAR